MSHDESEIIKQGLSGIWGYSEFRPHQRETIDAIRAGQDSLTVLPTGGGKSLCYQLPAAVSQGTAVVLSPLISLMEDQVKSLQLLGIPAAFLNSSQNAAEVRAAKTRMFRGELRLLYISPERLNLEQFREELKQVKIDFFAIDEAHCISQWGHDFRPEYQSLDLIRQHFPQTSIHAFTATAPPRVRDEIIKQLKLKEPKVMVGSYHRPNLTYRVVRRARYKQQLLEVLSRFNPHDSGIVYCLTRKETESVADHLRLNGYKALAYHAGMSSEMRTRHQRMFAGEEIHIMVATLAFGMGIDQSNVRFVVHSGMPMTLSHYQQESGRAGRDGLPSQCILFFGPRDIQFWKRIIEEEDSIVPIKTAQLQAMINYCNRIECRHKMLVEYFGQDFDRENCNACDTCLGEIDSISDARTISRKIISAVLKVRQSFGAGYVAQVLTGSREKKVVQNGHDQLSVYNLLGDYSREQVHDWINQLESQGYLSRTGGDFPTIAVSDKGYWLLRPDKFGKNEKNLPVSLVETRRKQKPSRFDRVAVSNDDPGLEDRPQTYDPVLFEHLRKVRKQIADRLGVPAFIIFGDRSIQDMARRKPTDERAFLQIFGVGTHKLERFGHEMIDAVNEYLVKYKTPS